MCDLVSRATVVSSKGTKKNTMDTGYYILVLPKLSKYCQAYFYDILFKTKQNTTNCNVSIKTKGQNGKVFIWRKQCSTP
jgi:hypothetical protein